MTALSAARIFFHGLLWCCAVVLLGLTAYRIHYTKRSNTGDVLTSRTHYYDPIIVELLVTSILTFIGSLAIIAMIASRMGGPKSFMGELLFLFIVWVMFLVGAAITTHKWLHLKWCRGSQKVCRILETIKAFSWICFGLISFLMLFAIADYFWSRHRKGGSAYGGSTYPEARTTTTAPATYTAPAPATQQPPATHTTETTYTEVRATNAPVTATA
ncbi:hypothetical protein MD484_g4070, partial [Candolleomyces efflorescens]